MSEANAPARPRGLGRWLAAWVVAVGLPTLLAMPALARQQGDPPQTQTKGEEPTPEPAAEPAQEEPAAEEPTPEEEDEQDVLSDTIFVDPKATAAMRGTFEPLHSGVLVPTTAEGNIAQMARGGGRFDASLIDRFIKYAARRLTDPNNIAAAMSPDGANAKVQEIQEAGAYLMLPYLEVPPEQRDRRFMQEFNSRLLAVAPDLLKNHLYARVQLMQALSRMGDPQALGLLIELLGSEDQPLIVKQLAAEGIERIAAESGNALSPADRERAATALVTFVKNNPEAYWLAQARALHALGTLRQLYAVQTRDQAVFGVEALAVIVDEEARLETRGWAGWALGMLDVPPNYPQLNFKLASYHVGRLAMDVGERIVELSDPRETASYNPQRVQYLTGLLVSPIFPSLDGAPELRGSGLRNSQGLGPHQQYVLQVHQLVKQLTASAVELTRAVGGQVAERRDGVIASLNELRAFLTENPPEDGSFVPGGREFALQDAS